METVEIKELIESYPVLKICQIDIEMALEKMFKCYSSGKKIIICGNGGSASDAEHITGEFLKGFESKRPINQNLQKKINDVGSKYPNALKLVALLQDAIPAVCLNSQTSVITAIGNDIGYEMVFAQQLLGLGNKGDILVAISASGNSENVINAVLLGKALGIESIGLTGGNGGGLKNICDACICVPENLTRKIQELHLPVYHALCLSMENHFFQKMKVYKKK